MWHHAVAMVLTASAFAKAAKFVSELGRPLERALLALHFGDGDVDALDAELSLFQNDDGGFGRAIEPDLRCQESSVAATVTGLRLLSESGAPPDSRLVRAAVEYLLERYDPDRGGWPKVPPAANDAPHAEWWHHPDGQAASDAPESWALVNVDAIVLLHDYSMLVPAGVLEEVTETAVRRLGSLPDEVEMHVFAAYRRLVSHLDTHRKLGVMTRLVQIAERIVVREPERWSEYTATPLWIAPSPDSPFAMVVPWELQANLDFEIASQRPDGSWRPRWRWSAYPEVWPRAEQEWAGVLTVRTLVQLREFGRIEAR